MRRFYTVGTLLSYRYSSDNVTSWSARLCEWNSYYGAAFTPTIFLETYTYMFMESPPPCLFHHWHLVSSLYYKFNGHPEYIPVEAIFLHARILLYFSFSRLSLSLFSSPTLWFTWFMKISLTFCCTELSTIALLQLSGIGRYSNIIDIWIKKDDRRYSKITQIWIKLTDKNDKLVISLWDSTFLKYLEFWIIAKLKKCRK